MKKLMITLLLLAPILVASQTYTGFSQKNYWWKQYNKFKYLPTITNSGGTITDTLATQDYVRDHGGVTDTTGLSSRIDAINEELADTVQLYDAISDLSYMTLPADSTANILATEPAYGTIIFDVQTGKLCIYVEGVWYEFSMAEKEE